jgi:hypothetical protein
VMENSDNQLLSVLSGDNVSDCAFLATSHRRGSHTSAQL